MHDWEQSNKASIPEKEDVHRHLNMNFFTYAGYTQAKKTF